VTDSGTVATPRTADGTWELRGDSLFLAYTYRWCAPYYCSDPQALRDTGRVATGGVVLYRIAGLGPRALGPGRPLLFRRQ
jgi:hypothetical protein